MIKIEKYDGSKTYMSPNGDVATKESILKQFPAVLTFTHIVETDEGGEVCFAVQNLSAMRTLHNIDSNLSEEEAIAMIQEIINTPSPEPEPTAEERIAASMEYQNLLAIPDEVTETTEHDTQERIAAALEFLALNSL